MFSDTIALACSYEFHDLFEFPETLSHNVCLFEDGAYFLHEEVDDNKREIVSVVLLLWILSNFDKLGAYFFSHAPVFAIKLFICFLYFLIFKFEVIEEVADGGNGIVSEYFWVFAISEKLTETFLIFFFLSLGLKPL